MFLILVTYIFYKNDSVTSRKCTYKWKCLSFRNTEFSFMKIKVDFVLTHLKCFTFVMKHVQGKETSRPLNALVVADQFIFNCLRLQHLSKCSFSVLNQSIYSPSELERSSEAGPKSKRKNFHIFIILSDLLRYPLSGTCFVASFIGEKCVWSIDEMILTAYNTSTWRKACLNATVFTINPNCTGLELNPFFRIVKPRRTNSLEGGLALLLQCVHACIYLCIMYVYICIRALHACLLKVSEVVLFYWLFLWQEPLSPRVPKRQTREFAGTRR